MLGCSTGNHSTDLRQTFDEFTHSQNEILPSVNVQGTIL